MGGIWRCCGGGSEQKSIEEDESGVDLTTTIDNYLTGHETENMSVA
jgi:hypothetical protein